MKKYFITALIFVVGMIFFPGEAKAQASAPVWGYNGYLNYALARRKRLRTTKKKTGRVTKKRPAPKKNIIRRKKTGISLNENLVEPKFKFSPTLPAKRIYVV